MFQFVQTAIKLEVTSKTAIDAHNAHQVKSQIKLKHTAMFQDQLVFATRLLTVATNARTAHLVNLPTQVPLNATMFKLVQLTIKSEDPSKTVTDAKLAQLDNFLILTDSHAIPQDQLAYATKLSMLRTDARTAH